MDLLVFNCTFAPYLFANCAILPPLLHLFANCAILPPLLLFLAILHPFPSFNDDFEQNTIY